MKSKNIFHRCVLLILVVSVLFFCGVKAYAVPTKQLSYQGRLNNASGQPVPDGTYSIVFSIYNAATGGSPLWTETQNVSVANGGFSVYLGSVTALTLAFNEDYFLGIKVASDPEMTPRLKLSVVGASAYSLEAEKLQGKAASDFALANHTHTGLSATTVNGYSVSATPTASTLLPLDSGAKFPTSVLNVGTTTGTIAAGDHTHTASGVTQIVAGTNVTVSPAGGTGVVTINSTPATGFVQLTPSSAQTMQATADVTPLIIKDDTAGTTADLLDVQDSAGTSLVKVNPSGNLLVGNPTTITAKVSAYDTGTTNYAGYFEVSNTSSTVSSLVVTTNSTVNTVASIYGLETGTTGTVYGVVGRSASTSGAGVFGDATATSGATIGILGKSFSGSGYGGYFRQEATTGTAGAALYASVVNAGFGGTLIAGNHTGTGNLLQLQKTGADQLVVNNSGNLLVGNPATTTAKVSAYETGTANYAGYFETNNASSTNAVIYAVTNGNANTIYAIKNGTGYNAIAGEATGTSTGVLGYTTGTGRAGRFEINNATNADYAVYAHTNGIGKAGFFQVNNASNSSDVIAGETSGTGNLLRLLKSGVNQFTVANNGKLTFSTGANKAVGTGAIAPSTNTITIANTSVTASSLIFLTINNTTGTVTMPLKIGTITAGTSFVVDTGDGTNAPAGGINFNYFIVN